MEEVLTFSWIVREAARVVSLSDALDIFLILNIRNVTNNCHSYRKLKISISYTLIMHTSISALLLPFLAKR